MLPFCLLSAPCFIQKPPSGSHPHSVFSSPYPSLFASLPSFSPLTACCFGVALLRVELLWRSSPSVGASFSVSLCLIAAAAAALPQPCAIVLVATASMCASCPVVVWCVGWSLFCFPPFGFYTSLFRCVSFFSFFFARAPLSIPHSLSVHSPRPFSAPQCAELHSVLATLLCKSKGGGRRTVSSHLELWGFPTHRKTKAVLTSIRLRARTEFHTERNTFFPFDVGDGVGRKLARHLSMAWPRQHTGAVCAGFILYASGRTKNRKQKFQERQRSVADEVFCELEQGTTPWTDAPLVALS